MKGTIYLLLLAVSIQLTAGDPEKRMPVVKVYKNDLDKIYTVFFADTLQHTVSVALKDKRGTVLMQESITAKGFSKPFGLRELRNGDYEFVISFEDNTVNEPITLKSEKEIMERSITLKKDYPQLTINVSQYNMNPMNIFVYDSYDNLLKMFYWEPSAENPRKTLDIGKFEGYEIRLQIVQDGEDKLDQLVQLF